MASTYTQQDGGFIATNEYLAPQYQAYAAGIIYAFISGRAARSVSDVQEFPLDAIVGNAIFDVKARAPGSNVPFADVSEISVRDADGIGEDDAVVVDFGTLTTMKNIYPGPGNVILRLYTWTGTDWRWNPSPQAEFASQRVLLEFEDSVSAEQVEETGSVTMPGAPSNIEMLLDGIVVWTDRQGGEVITDGWRIDRTDLVRQALTRLKTASVVGDTSVSLRVELRADVLADLTIVPDIEISRVHRVVFPNGPIRTIDNSAEGPVTVSLPLPEAATSWSIDMVQVRAAASLGPERVQPARGPDFTDDAKLGLKRGRSIMLRLPDTLTSRFATISGIRIPIVGEGSEGELGGQILGARADLAGPGAPIEGGGLTPVSVPSGEVPVWTTLELADDLDVSDGPFWVELIVSYGDLVCALTHKEDSDPVTPGAVIHRRLPGGGSRPLTSFDSQDIAPLFGAVRIVGTAGPNTPIDALLLNLEDPSSGDLDELVEIGVTPISDGVAMFLKLPNPAVPASASLQLVGATAVGGVFTFDEIDVIYQEAGT
jgi:hypothetical protein